MDKFDPEIDDDNPPLDADFSGRNEAVQTRAPEILIAQGRGQNPSRCPHRGATPGQWPRLADTRQCRAWAPGGEWANLTPVLRHYRRMTEPSFMTASDPLRTLTTHHISGSLCVFGGSICRSLELS